MSNHLSNEKSPYLLQHKDNPVDWYPWCREAFEKSAREDRPIFLSIGYSTCHWCHVMAQESFEDREVAQILNREYICIKVDREERPDVDSVYMSVCQAVTGAGGWPLTVIMTPEQKPFFVGTYFPKYRRYGQAGLIEMLEMIADMWKNSREELLASGEEITAVIRQNRINRNKEPEKEILRKAYELFQRQFDAVWGGFGLAPKFPAPHNLLFLMRYAVSENVPDAMKMAEITLDAMGKGGMYDQIGGGFSRYSTDDRWLVPHFEKMLYDNALLTLAYLNAYQITGKKEYAHIARCTADYILGELKDEKGGFYCGQDADSEGEEGKYYVFTPEEIKRVLGERDGAEFCALYGITEDGNFEGKSIPNRIGQKLSGWNADDWRIKKLYQYRLTRTRLHKDDKILLSWNGWAIIALIRTGQILEEGRCYEAAFRAQHFIEEYMTDQDNRLYLRFRDGEAAHMGQLDDYAVYVLALLELYQGTLKIKYLQKAIQYAKQMQTLFEDKEGGYYLTSSDGEKLIVRPKEIYDGAIPSGNSVAGLVLFTLAALTGEETWQEAADRQFRFLAGVAEDYPVGHSFAMYAFAEAFYPHKELLCAIRGELPEELTEYLRKTPGYGLNILVKTPDNEKELAECAPYTKDYPLPERGAVYYLCENGTCRTPVTEFGELGLKF